MAVPLYDYIISINNLFPYKKIKNTKHLYTDGSIIQMGCADAVICGSGLIREDNYRWK